ncbi:MAG: hypothetical protein GY803_27430 [Chloroflexi bacterium]|nr:hypothetical protein [Chloroflexota bacterium]
MISCARCNNSVMEDEAHWVRRKSVKERAPLCSACFNELRQKKAKTNPIAANVKPEARTVRNSGKKVPSWLQAMTSAESEMDATSSATAVPPTTDSQTNPLDAILILILLIFLAAPLLGALVAWIGNFLYLIIAFPIIIGIGGGHVVNRGVRWGKLRDPLTAAFFGILFGLIEYGSYRVTEYAIFKNEVQDVVAEEYGVTDTTLANAFLDEILYAETGYTGFVGFVLLNAKEGMSITRRRASGSLNIGTTLTWLYWLFEMGAFTFFPAGMAYAETKRPFCAYHNRWFDKERSLGGIPAETAPNTLAYLEERHFNTFGKALSPKVPVPGIDVCIERCPNCQESMPVLTIKAVRKGSRGKKDEKVIGQHRIEPTQCEQLLDGVKQVGAFQQ